MNLYLVTPDHEKPIAEGFAPDDLPARAILQSWITLAQSTMTVNELSAKLSTGQAFAFGAGRLEWFAE